MVQITWRYSSQRAVSKSTNGSISLPTATACQHVFREHHQQASVLVLEHRKRTLPVFGPRAYHSNARGRLSVELRIHTHVYLRAVCAQGCRRTLNRTRLTLCVRGQTLSTFRQLASRWSRTTCCCNQRSGSMWRSVGNPPLATKNLLENTDRVL